MFALWASAALLVAAFAAAFALTWRGYGAEPVRVEANVEGPTCYPRVKR